MWKYIVRNVSLLFLILLIVACGSSAAPTAVENEVTTEVTKEVVTVANPTPSAVEKEVTAEVTAAKKDVATEVTKKVVTVPTPTPALTPLPEKSAVNPGSLTVMVGDFGPERFDITFSSGPWPLAYGRTLHGFLISTNERLEHVPGIATEWALSPDGLTWTFDIRKGVKFHDGSDLTAEDVLWSLQHYFSPEAAEYSTQQGAIQIAKGMDTIELAGGDRISVTTTKPILDFGNSNSEAGTNWYAVLPKRTNLNDEQEALNYDRNPIGAGPMKLEEHVGGQVMKFERFDEFYYQPKNGFSEDKRMNFQSLHLVLVPEEATRVAALQAGEADIVPTSLTGRKQVEDSGGRILFGQEGAVVEVRMHGCWDPQYPCQDKRVRQALDYAIDKELIRDQLFSPEVFQIKGWDNVTPSTMGYTPDLDPRPFDPDKARQLLADAGYPGGQGFGKLVINTWPTTKIPFQVEMVQLIADFWKTNLGLDVEINVGDTTAIKKLERGGELRGQILWREQSTRIDAARTMINKFGSPGGNIMLLKDDPDDELVRLVRETYEILEEGERMEAIEKLYLRLRDESYGLGIGYVNIPWGVGPRVLEWQPYPLSQHPSALHTVVLK